MMASKNFGMTTNPANEKIKVALETASSEKQIGDPMHKSLSWYLIAHIGRNAGTKMKIAKREMKNLFAMEEHRVYLEWFSADVWLQMNKTVPDECHMRVV